MNRVDSGHALSAFRFSYYGARYYDSAAGRFLSEDPIRAGMNFYQYSHDNPTNFVDPFGLKDNASPWLVGVEWLTGRGPSAHYFTDGDPFAEQLRHHEWIQQLINDICSGKKPSKGSAPYNLGGWQGIPKYLRDYSTLLTLGRTGNLAVTYLGSYRLDYSVNNGVLDIQVYNPSTIASATHPPYIGYTVWWNNHVGKPLNNFFSSGPLSQTEQFFDLHENLGSRCGCGAK